MTESHFRKLEKMYLNAKVNSELYETTTCTISEGSSEISLLVSDKYFHALNAIHGSVYFKLLDDAAFFAVNSVITENFVLTKSFTIDFKRPVTHGRIVAKGEVTDISGSSFRASSTLVNEDGKIVGSGSGEFVKSKVPLSPEIGYK